MLILHLKTARIIDTYNSIINIINRYIFSSSEYVFTVHS